VIDKTIVNVYGSNSKLWNGEAVFRGHIRDKARSILEINDKKLLLIDIGSQTAARKWY
jgi:hypothetical protein